MTDFISKNQWVIPLVILILTAFFNYVNKPRTPEEFAVMNPYWATFIRLTCAFGLDPQKVIEIVKQGVPKKEDEPK